jgi:demethylmenaquinone methyltransferase/2-methoxy-6-polyprenyl-1,4-benzoquinol methylase
MPIQADAARLPLAAESVDTILVVDALHHFLRPQHMVREMLRVLKPGGRLLIEEQDINHFFIKLLRTAERIVGLHSHFLTCDEIRVLFPATRYCLHYETGNFFSFSILVCKR